jgi:hypothetical protein
MPRLLGVEYSGAIRSEPPKPTLNLSARAAGDPVTDPKRTDRPISRGLFRPTKGLDFTVFAPRFDLAGQPAHPADGENGEKLSPKGGPSLSQAELELDRGAVV